MDHSMTRRSPPEPDHPGCCEIRQTETLRIEACRIGWPARHRAGFDAETTAWNAEVLISNCKDLRDSSHESYMEPTTALIAATFTMSLTLHPRERSKAGRRKP